MGFNTVAVLYNDQTDSIRAGGHTAERMADAISHGWYLRKRDPLATYFVLALSFHTAHADEEQVVIVSRNSGCRAEDADDLGWQALETMKACLERHGYTVSKKRKSPPPASQGREGKDEHDEAYGRQKSAPCSGSTYPGPLRSRS